jgi:hypothetical protein
VAALGLARFILPGLFAVGRNSKPSAQAFPFAERADQNGMKFITNIAIAASAMKRVAIQPKIWSVGPMVFFPMTRLCVAINIMTIIN